MKSLYLTAVLMTVAVPAPAQSLASNPSIKPAVDSPRDREILRNMSMCLARQRPRWARSMLSHPYLSDAQASAAAEAISGNDQCLRTPEVEMTFRTSTIVGALAEHFVRADISGVDLDRVSNALATTMPLNSSEDFALCVASRNPKAAVDFVRSDPGSASETAAANSIASQLASCTQPGERLDVDMQALRSLVATALYRGITAVTGSAG